MVEDVVVNLLALLAVNEVRLAAFATTEALAFGGVLRKTRAGGN